MDPDYVRTQENKRVMREFPRISPFGDRAVLLEFGDEINPEVLFRIKGLTDLLTQKKISGVTELIPSYCSLFIGYDPLCLSFRQMSSWLRKNLVRENSAPPLSPIKKVPVIYGGEYGPDLSYVAEFHRSSPEEVVRWHTSVTYLVYAIGGFPGLPAMGIVPKEIETPRLAIPRTRVEPGSIGIAGKQTGIYAIESPGGWQLIGRTPLKIFDPALSPPAFFTVGDRVQFFPVL